MWYNPSSHPRVPSIPSSLRPTPIPLLLSTAACCYWYPTASPVRALWQYRLSGEFFLQSTFTVVKVNWCREDVPETTKIWALPYMLVNFGFRWRKWQKSVSTDFIENRVLSTDWEGVWEEKANSYLWLDCSRKIDSNFSLSCLKIALISFSAEHEELQTHNTRQSVLPGCTVTPYLRTMGKTLWLLPQPQFCYCC